VPNKTTLTIMNKLAIQEGPGETTVVYLTL